MFDLHGRKALVTGATGGIGGAIARALHAQGATVALSGTRRDALDALARDLGERVHVIEANLSDKAAVEALVPAAEAAMGGLDILVNNAGITRDNLFLRMKDEEWDAVIAVNLTAAFRLSRAAVKGMMRRRHGRIVGITSVVGSPAIPGRPTTRPPRPGLIGLSKALAAEVASRNITVNCVAPGFIESPMTDALEREAARGDPRDVPTGRLGTGAEIARGRRLPRLRRGGLRDRPDAPRQRRHGHVLMLGAHVDAGAYAVAPLARARRRVLSTARSGSGA